MVSLVECVASDRVVTGRAYMANSESSRCDGQEAMREGVALGGVSRGCCRPRGRGLSGAPMTRFQSLGARILPSDRNVMKSGR